MLIKRENLENNQVLLTIRMEKESWIKGLDDAYEELKHHFANEDGSLLTKATVEEQYGEDVFYQHVVNSTFSQLLSEALRQENISFISTPELTVQEIGPDGYTFTAQLELPPPVKLGQYKGLSAPRPTAELSEEDTVAAIEAYLQQHPAEEHPDKSAMGDEVVIDFEGFIDGVPFEGGKGEQYPLLLGSGYFIPGFEEQVAGMAVNDEWDISIVFPTEYTPELAGKDAVFHIKVHRITRRTRSELNDAFARANGFEDASALRRSIMEQTLIAKQQEAADAYADELVQQVIDSMEVEIPDHLVQAQVDDLLQSLELQLQGQGMSMDSYLEMSGLTRDDLRKQSEGNARHVVAFELAMTEIARLENLQITDAELEEKYIQLSAMYCMSVEDLKKNLPADRLMHDLMLTRARAVVVENSIQK